MRGGHGNHGVRESASNRHGGHKQALRHGGAGAVQSQMGNAGISQSEGRADALVQQIPGKYDIKIRHGQTGLFRQFPQSQLLHLFFRLFPGFLPEIGVPALDVEGMGQRPLDLLFPGNIGPCGNDRRLGQYKTLASPFLTCHDSTFLNLFSIVCALLRKPCRR